MNVFSVTKPGGTKDYEFEAYTRLLEEIGVDVANVPRIPEPETHRRWLYAWQRKEEAEGFARELKARTRDGSWHVHQSSVDEEDRGPVAPLDIYQASANGEQEFMYYLSPSSRERVIQAYPHTRLTASLSISRDDLDKIKQRDGDVWWDQLPVMLTGLGMDQVLSLGGYRIVLPNGVIGHESLPEIPAAV
jgi:hypothetical protein